MRIKRILLKHEGDVAFGRHLVRYNAPLDQHVASIGPLQAGDQTQRRCLSSTGWAKQHEKFTVGDGERKAPDRLHGAIAPADVHKCDLSHGFLLRKAMNATLVRLLHRTEIFGANDTTSQRRGIGERHILRPHTKGEAAFGAILEYLRHFDADAVNLYAAIATLQ